MRRCAWRARAGGCRVAESRTGPLGDTGPPERPAPDSATPDSATPDRATPDGRADRRTGLVVAVAAGVLAADALTKQWALRGLAEGPVTLVGSVRLALTYNSAGAFGLGGAVVPFLALGALVLVIVMVTTGSATSRTPAAVALGLVLGGAFGNLADRVFRHPGLLRGAVVDFVDLRFWPVFNLADAAITCGCLVLLWASWTRR